MSNNHMPGCPKDINPQALCCCGADTKELPPVDAVNQPPPQFDNYIDLMHRTGGNFARAIAEAFYRADSSNRMRLLTAFDDLFAKYKTQFNQWKENQNA